MIVPIVELSGISKDYHGLRPLRIDALSLAPGDQTAIVGLDQPMAETFVNLMTGATLPDRGEVKIFGRSTASIDNSAEWLAVVDRFGIVSERAVLLDAYSVMQNLSLPYTLEIDPVPDDVRERAATLAREVGFEEPDWSRRVADLDATDRFRIRLGRALALDPAVLLLEHASAGLPRQEMTTLGSRVRNIARRRNLAIVAITADRNFAHSVAARVLLLDPATGRLGHTRAGWWSRVFFG